MGSTNYAMNSMRFFAALAVVVSHVRPLFFVDYGEAESSSVVTQALYAVTSLGHQAVIIFFVLSGYWVGGSVIRGLARGGFNAASYTSARLTRLWLVLIPALFLTQILDRLGSALFPSSDVYQGSEAYHTVVPVDGPLPHLGVLDTLGNVFFLQDLYVTSAGTNTPLWSLAAEFWYYLLFPAILTAVWPGGGTRRRLLSGAIGVAGILIVSLAIKADATQVLVLFPVWLAGAAVAWKRDAIADRLAAARQSTLTVARSAALAAVLGTAAIDSRVGSLPTKFAVALATAGLIAVLVTDVSGPWPRKALGPWSWAAEWSYSLYAIHLPVIAILSAALLPDAQLRWQMTPGSFLLLLALTAIPVAVAVGFYFAFERHTSRVRALFTRPAPQMTR